MGYVFYYRLFTSDTELETTVGSLTGTQEPSDLIGYHYLYDVEFDSGSSVGYSRSSPMVKIDAGDKASSFVLTFNMSDISYASPDFASNVDWLAETQYFGRYIYTTDSPTQQVEKSFKASQFVEGDSDLPSDFQDGDNLFLSIYVMSYGRDEDFSSLYSIPKELGRFNLNIN